MSSSSALPLTGPQVYLSSSLAS